jgi:tetratricopeptide (TPR) repeat protein
MSPLREILDATAHYTLLALVALSPVLIIPGSGITVPQGKFLLMAAAIGVITCAWAAARFVEGQVSVPWSPILAAAVLLPLAYAVSALLSGSFLSSFVSGLGEQDTVATVVLVVLALAATAWYVRSATALRDVTFALIAGLVLLIAFEVARVLVPAFTLVGGFFPIPVATAAGTWHDLGILAALCAYLTLALPLLGLLESIRLRAVALGVSAATFAFLIVISLSDVWYSIAIMGAVTAVFLLIREERHDAGQVVRMVAPWALMTLSAILVGWFSSGIHSALPEGIKRVAVEVRPSWQGTLDISQATLSEGKTLFFGSGPNSFAKNWVRSKPAGVNETLFWNYDFNAGVGTVPTSLVTLGVVGIITWAILAVAFLYTLGSALRHSQLKDEASAIFVLGVVTLYLFTYQIIYVPGIVGSLYLFVLLGALSGYASLHRCTALPIGMRHAGHFLTGAAVAVPVAAALLIAIPGARAVASDVAVNRAITEYAANQDPTRAAEDVQRAISWWGSNSRAHRAAVELGIIEMSRIAASGGAANQETLQATLTKTIEHGLSAIRIDDSDYQNWLTLAQLYQELSGAGVEGAIAEARTAYQEALADNPSNPVPHVRLAQLAIAEKDAQTALKHLDEAIRLKQNFALAHYIRSQLLAETGNLEGAVQSAAAVVQIVPQDPLAWYSLGTILYAGKAYSDAASAFAKAAILRPDYANAYFMYGMTASAVGEFGQATQAFMKVAELDPNQPLIPALIANVSQGKQPLEGLSQ